MITDQSFPWNSWRSFPAAQQPQYPDLDHLKAVTAKLRKRPPLVFAGEADSLREQMGRAARGEAFVLMGGDCAETFDGSTADQIRLKIQTLLQMSVVLTYGASLPVVKVGRIAGQYAKPRSSDTETRDGKVLPSYRGDAVNDIAFTEEARVANPERLLETYQQSAASLNLIRAFTKGGYADMRRVHTWNRGFTKNPAYARYEALASEIHRAIMFIEAAGADFDGLKVVDLYSAHEALLLEYEAALTRIDSRSGELYNTSGHFLWIGERTRQLDGAHIELLREARNPVGVKVGPTVTPEEVIGIIEKLNPEGEEGRLTFITRMGADKIRDVLPNIASAVARDGRPVVWITDPMHGNTIETAAGVKTRDFDTIMNEVEGFFEVLYENDMVPAGLHIELTGDDVTEVLGGSENLDELRLNERYETRVDPRLNHQQSLEIAFRVAELLRRSQDLGE